MFMELLFTLTRLQFVKIVRRNNLLNSDEATKLVTSLRSHNLLHRMSKTTKIPSKTTKIPSKTTKIPSKTTKIPSKTTKIPSKTTK